MESLSLRRKVSGVRQENACLSMLDEKLINDITNPRSQFHHRGPRASVESSVAVMSVQLRQLEVELEAQAGQLKAAELSAECSQEEAAHNEIVVATLSEELGALREELDNTTALTKRAEQQRNQALDNAEKLKEAFKDYKATISIKLSRVMESESKLKESLIECDLEKEELETKCSALQRERAELGQTISQLKEEAKQAKSSAAERSHIQSQLEEARRRASLLERQLEEWGVQCGEVAALRREVEELRTQNQNQEQRVAQSYREAQQSQAELSGLEAALSLLHLREGALGTLCSKPCMLPPVDYSINSRLMKLKPGEGYQQLVRVLQCSEAERSKQSGLVQQLQEHFSRAQEEIATLQSTMAQRAAHYQNLHTELLDKVSQATNTESELKRRSARVAALEKQLQEKTSAYSQAALKNTELENQLQEKASNVQHYQSLLTKKQREYQQSLDKCKRSHSQQCTEQQHKLEMWKLSVEEVRSRLSETEQQLCLCQRERDEAQRAALLLQTSVEQLTQEKQVEVRHSDEMLQSFKEQAAQSTEKVCELKSSLSACQEELASYLQQMGDVKMSYERELQKSKEKVSALQEQLHNTTLVCQRSSEQNLQLQVSLQQQQRMLTDSNSRISELEESQCQLQRQVSSLEQQLERERASLQEEVRSRELDIQEREKGLQEKNTQLAESVTNITSEMIKYRGELVNKETELQCLKKDISIKTVQLSRMEEILQQTRNKLSSRSDQVVDLEDKLHLCEADQLNFEKQVLVLQGQLQSVRAELTDTLEQLLKLKDILQITQSLADERQTSVEKLTVQLSETQRELEERTHEVLDMDIALKERQGELQQRAELLGQLDVAIKDHKQEMERKVESLQRSLETKERELRDTQRELKDRNNKKLQTLLQELEETRLHCEDLTRDLDTTKVQNKEKEVRLRDMEEEMALKEALRQQAEEELQSTLASVEQELEVEREQHSKELESLQQSRGQLLKVSEQMSSNMRSSQEQLSAKLHQSQTQLQQTKAGLDQTKAELERAQSRASLLQTHLDQSQTQLLHSQTQLELSRNLCDQNDELRAQVKLLGAQLQQTRVQAAQLQVLLEAQVQACEKSMETCNESMLIKSSHLHARISGLEPAADQLPLPLPVLHKALRPLEPPSAHSLPSSPEKNRIANSSLAQCLRSPTHARVCSSPPDLRYPSPTSHLSDTRDWLQSSASCSMVDSSLDLPPSVKAALKEALSKQPWEAASSFSASTISSFPSEVNLDWQGLGAAVDATATSDLSFNPLTYMLDGGDECELLRKEGEDGRAGESRRESECTLVGESQDEADRTSLTGMLRFVKQTLAMQDDPSLWSSTGMTDT